MGLRTGSGGLPGVDARAGAEGTRPDLDGICRWFGSGDTMIKALHNVNLHVDEAAFVVVLGPSGSGKATLLNLASALHAPRPAAGEQTVPQRCMSWSEPA